MTVARKNAGVATVKMEGNYLSEETKELYWVVLEDCLVELHGLPREEANEKSRDLRERMEATVTIPDLFYHDQPFKVANTITKRKLDYRTHLPQYKKILEKHGWL